MVKDSFNDYNSCHRNDNSKNRRPYSLFSIQMVEDGFNHAMISRCFNDSRGLNDGDLLVSTVSSPKRFLVNVERRASIECNC